MDHSNAQVIACFRHGSRLTKMQFVCSIALRRTLQLPNRPRAIWPSGFAVLGWTPTTQALRHLTQLTPFEECGTSAATGTTYDTAPDVAIQ